MPELPEVENVVLGLKKLIKNYIINSVVVKEDNIIAYPDSESFSQQIKDKEIIDIFRRGKYLLFKLSQGKTMVIHLRMTGKLLVKPSSEPIQKHTHVIFKLNNNMDLRFNNVRKFGRVYLIDSDERENAGGLADLGPEPLSDNFTFDKFKNLFEGRTGRIKPLLLNQRFIAGLGNIYTDEALFRSRIHPLRKADTLTEDELKDLYNAIREVLKLGIKYNGTSFSDYVNALGEKGSFQAELLVYQREGENCPNCKTEIVRKKVGGRSSFYCPKCQKNPNKVSN